MTSLRESTLGSLRSSFEQFLTNVKDTASKPVIVRGLTEAFQKQEKEMGELCDRMEKRILAQRDSCLSAHKKLADEVVKKLVSSLSNPDSLKKELEQLEQTRIAHLEIERQGNISVDQWRLEFAQEVRKIAIRFQEEAINIMTEGLYADYSMEILDPNSSLKQ